MRLICGSVLCVQYSVFSLSQTQPGLIKIRTSVHFLCDTVLCTLLHVSPQFQRECPLSGAKTQVKYVNPGTFLLRRYRYISVCFIMLLQKRIASVVQNSNIRVVSLKVNALSGPTPNPTLNLPDSVNNSKTDIKNIC